MAKPLISDAEIKRRKKQQARISQATGALGLAALGGTALATKPGQAALRRATGNRVPKNLQSKPKEPGLDRTITPLLATSAGIGSIGSFNFARYTDAESRKRGPVNKSYSISAFGVVHD